MNDDECDDLSFTSSHKHFRRSLKQIYKVLFKYFILHISQPYFIFITTKNNEILMKC